MNNKGSVLVVTIIILGFVLITALSVSLVTVSERKASIGESKSGVAFQHAQSGVELVMQDIINFQSRTVGNLPSFDCSVPSGGSHAVLTPSSSYYTGLFEIELKKQQASESTNCSTLAKDIASVKSVGVGTGTQRAIEAAVADTTLTWDPVDFGSNGWTNFGGTFVTAQYAKDNRTGLVYLRGTIEKGSGSCSGTSCNIATLPGDYQPAGTLLFSQLGQGNAMFRIEIFSNGLIRVIPNAGVFPESFLSLDGIVFAAE